MIKKLIKATKKQRFVICKSDRGFYLCSFEYAKDFYKKADEKGLYLDEYAKTLKDDNKYFFDHCIFFELTNEDLAEIDKIAPSKNYSVAVTDVIDSFSVGECLFWFLTVKD